MTVARPFVAADVLTRAGRTTAYSHAQSSLVRARVLPQVVRRGRRSRLVSSTHIFLTFLDARCVNNAIETPEIHAASSSSCGYIPAVSASSSCEYITAVSASSSCGYIQAVSASCVVAVELKFFCIMFCYHVYSTTKSMYAYFRALHMTSLGRPELLLI